MSNKSYISYMYIFNDLKLLVSLNKIKIKWQDKIFITDFEKGLLKSIPEQFPNTKYIGCYYHYCKALWIYARNHRCYNKKTKKEIIFILFCYKLYPFVGNKADFIDKIDNMIEKSFIKNVFIKFSKYFKKYWKDKNVLNCIE